MYFFDLRDAIFNGRLHFGDTCIDFLIDFILTIFAFIKETADETHLIVSLFILSVFLLDDRLVPIIVEEGQIILEGLLLARTVTHTFLSWTGL